MNMAMADSYIAGFKIRYVYDFWRPVTAIREGDNDGNDATAGDPPGTAIRTRRRFRTTRRPRARSAAPPPPCWPASSAATRSASRSPAVTPFDGLTRSFTSFSQAARESADSRIYAGIHFRSACEDGLVLGRKVGQRATTMYLQPARK